MSQVSLFFPFHQEQTKTKMGAREGEDADGGQRGLLLRLNVGGGEHAKEPGGVLALPPVLVHDHDLGDHLTNSEGDLSVVI